MPWEGGGPITSSPRRREGGVSGGVAASSPLPACEAHGVTRAQATCTEDGLLLVIG